MDNSQLEGFVKGVVLRERPPELGFLPEHFWFEPLNVGPDVERSVGGFFGGLSGIVYLALKGEFTRHDGTRLDFDPNYRTRIQDVMVRIADECLRHQGLPTRRELLLAQAVVDAAERLNRNSPVYDAAVRLAKDTRYSGLKNLESIR